MLRWRLARLVLNFVLCMIVSRLLVWCGVVLVLISVCVRWFPAVPPKRSVVACRFDGLGR